MQSFREQNTDNKLTQEILESLDNLVSDVWAEALRYGASVLPENGTCRKHGIGPTGFGCVFCADVEGSNATLEDSRSTLLEEADKAVKGV